MHITGPIQGTSGPRIHAQRYEGRFIGWVNIWWALLLLVLALGDVPDVEGWVGLGGFAFGIEWFS